MKNKIIITVSILFTLTILYIALNVISVKSQDKSLETGRYAVSTSYTDTGGWLFVTIIDTQTGQLVKQEKFNDSDYKKK